ncbi:MAG: CAP domain-containing protein [Candidatus Staskawiczbacteria bacterium]|nr:CAP domain-containing protein [Candidatus Staskawiczbacteria bacterium]
MEKYKVIILVVLILALSLVFVFQGSIMKVYNYFGINLHRPDGAELGNIIGQVAREILTSSPLNIGGKENQVILVKEKVLAETNIQRYNNNMLPPLVENAKLIAAAQAKAEDMLKNEYFEHISPSGVNSGQLVRSFGYEYMTMGENLIRGNFSGEKELVQLWMASPGHRANILNTRFTEIGVAVAKGTYKGQTVWIGVQEFGLQLPNCPEADVVLKAKIDANKKKLNQLYSQMVAKEKEIDAEGKGSEKYNALVDQYNNLVSQYNILNPETKKFISQYNVQVNAFNECVNVNE